MKTSSKELIELYNTLEPEEKEVVRETFHLTANAFLSGINIRHASTGDYARFDVDNNEIVINNDAVESYEDIFVKHAQYVEAFALAGVTL